MLQFVNLACNFTSEITVQTWFFLKSLEYSRTLLKVRSEYQEKKKSNRISIVLQVV